jgi:hypothetical protein
MATEIGTAFRAFAAKIDGCDPACSVDSLIEDDEV